MKHFIYCILILLITNNIAWSQPITEKSSDIVIKEAIELYDDKKYEEALKMFETISRNDSNYSHSVYERALTHFALKEYDKCLKLCEEGVTFKTEYDHEFYELAASGYDEKGQFREAIATYDTAIKKFPLAHKLYFEKGITLSKAKKYAEAESCFIKSILMNPFHPGSHLQLANVYNMNGYVVPAIYAYMGYLTIEPDTKRSLSALATIENISLAKGLPSPDSIVDLNINKENYSEAELILHSEVARDKKYKLKTKADYVTTRQIQSMLEKVIFDKNNKEFWMQFYVSFFNEMDKNNLFEPYTYYILQSVDDNEKLMKIIKAETGEIEKFKNWAIDNLAKRRDDYFSTIGRGKNIKYSFYPSGMPKSSGIYNESKKLLTSDYERYYAAGYLHSKGNFDNEGKKQGKWEYYYPANRIKTTGFYKDDVPQGEYAIYYENGKLKETGTFNAGKAEGMVVSYYATGVKSFEGKFKDDLKEGRAATYYRTGILKEEAEYTAGKLNGFNKTYYATGELKDDFKNANDKYEGKFKRYHSNGKLEVEGNFVNGEKEGEWTWYYEDGQTEKKVNFKAGKENGKYISYFKNGLLQEESEYSNGKANGKFIDYDEDGKMYYEGIYSNDKLNSYKYFNKKGEVISQSAEIKNEQEMKMYYPEGYLRSSGKITNKTKISTWRYYDIYGNLQLEEIYDNKGKLNGSGKRYYVNGQLKEEFIYKDGELDGYFKKYHSNGKLAEEGRYDNGVEQGTWTTYYINGKPEESTYYLNGLAEGYSESYNPDGKKDEEDFFELEHFNGTTHFDTAGTITNYIRLDCGTGKMNLNYPNNKIKLDAFLKNGKYDGALKRYFPNGKLKIETSYSLGATHGVKKEYHVNGNLAYESYFKYGVRDSVAKNYDEEGKLEQQTYYKKGDMDGESTWYYPNGQKEIIVFYKAGDREGYYYYYAPDGSVLFRFNYHRNNLVSYSYMDNTGKYITDIPFTTETKQIKTYYANGILSAEINYDKAYRHGTAHYFYPSGKTMSEKNYIYGDYHGVNKEYYENGALKNETTYYYDEKDGIEKEYNSTGKLVKETIYIAGYKNGKQTTYDPKTLKPLKTIHYIYGDPYEQQ
ncbi:MAG: hypothetical protein POELPBGB_00068 [Bacteroidia bacterium]|nr:hypothetical protein [Bacteroidia bacterium]